LWGSLATLRESAVVGTSSQRRLAQLKALRRDVTVRDLRGNVDTRIRKLDEGQYDAVILASAGLLRLGLKDRISARIPIAEMLPAVGQGAIAIETRSDDEFTVQTTSKLDHHETRVACLAERAFLRGLGGGCQLPIAAHATIDRDVLTLDGLVAKPDGSEIWRDSLSGTLDSAEQLGSILATRLIDRGAVFL
jgi:hydroxymethylbilane synthase